MRDISAVSGLLPQKCKAFPLSADVSAEVQGVSAASGLFLQKCRSGFDYFYVVKDSKGRVESMANARPTFAERHQSINTSVSLR